MRDCGRKADGRIVIIGVDGDENRLAMARRMGADVVLDYREVDVVAEVKRLTGGGADVAIEALGTQQTFESALRCLRPGGTLSSLGVYSGKLQMPYEAFAAGLAIIALSRRSARAEREDAEADGSCQVGPS